MHPDAPLLLVAGVALLAILSAIQWYLVNQALEFLRRQTRGPLSSKMVAAGAEDFGKAA